MVPSFGPPCTQWDKNFFENFWTEITICILHSLEWIWHKTALGSSVCPERCHNKSSVKLLSHIDALADAQGTNMVVRHTAKYVGCKFISRSLIGTIRSCAFMCVKGRKKFWTCSKIIFATNAQAYSFIVRWLYGPYVNRSLLGRSL